MDWSFTKEKKILGVIDLLNPMKNGEPRKYKFETLGLLEVYPEKVRDIFQKRRGS